MTDINILNNLDKSKPFLNHKNAVLSAPIRHLFMIGTIEYLSANNRNNIVDILEIGSWFGASTLSWGQAVSLYFDKNSSITCIDAWEPFFDMELHNNKNYALEMEALLESNFAYNAFLHNIGTLKDKMITQHFRGKSQNILSHLKKEKYDVIFIDADHTYEPVKNDIEKSLELVKDGGIICGDDLNLQLFEIDKSFAIKNKHMDFINDPKTKKNYHPGVTVAVNECFGEVSSWGGFWGMQKKGNNWKKYSLKNMNIIYPNHFTNEHTEKAKSHLNDIKDSIF